MIGIDTVSIPRIEKALKNDAFRDGVFTAREKAYCDGKPLPHYSYAGIFCAKEAAVKAVKCGFGRGVMPLDIEIDHEDGGAPILIAHGKAKPLFEKFRADVSISHDCGYAVAVVMLGEKTEKL